MSNENPIREIFRKWWEINYHHRNDQRVREDLEQQLRDTRHWWTVKEAAEYLGEEERGLRKKIKEGRMTVHKTGERGTKIYYLDLANYLMETRHSGGQKDF